jgi:hypothetical protein
VGCMGEGEIGFAGIASGKMGLACSPGSVGRVVDREKCFLNSITELSLRL